MKKLLILTLAILFGINLSTLAQENDTTRVKIGKKIITVIEGENDDVDVSVKSIDEDEDVDVDYDMEDLEEMADEEERKNRGKFDGHWAGFEFGFIGLVNENMEMPDKSQDYAIRPFRSWQFGLNLIQSDIALIGQNFGLVTGLGMTWKNYHFENDVEMDPNSDIVKFIDMPERNYTKNRLQATYLTVPLAFELQFPSKSGESEFFLMAGGYGNLKIGSNYRIKWEENGAEQDAKNKDDYHLRDFEYGLMGRIGFEIEDGMDINLFANYSMNTLFKDDAGPEFAPVTVGLTIVGF